MVSKKCTALKIFVGSLALFVGVMPVSGAAQTCKAPTAEKLADISAYALKRYHFAPNAEITLVDSGQANEACFWKFRFKVSSPRSEVIFYLSPDGQYLVPTLFDLRVDPLVEERAKSAALVKTLTAGDPPTLGPATASITIVEFSDFQCPFCKRMADIMSDLSPEDKKSLRVVFREFPLSMHPWAKPAAEMAGCAALQSTDSFWKLHNYLFENQKTFTTENLREKVTTFAVENAAIDKTQFNVCLDKKLATGGVVEDMEMGTRNGVKATPTLFINGTRYEGVKDAAQLHAIIASATQKLPAAPVTETAKTP